ncbi:MULTISPECIES: DUF2235 domain-containing protein [unclassified Bradyrhizobium]|uniref:DUF2235 domain-containing protein n=1 Tax=unclassified Bradyrhizobium TaxID=2631580 RepID=UPI0024786C6F|nr:MULTISPECIES: DUF2235 domain-containing protein [unclassified Bradyrhizobium]WGR72211.1 DUF2235 domain-containing protein [Bradyrhizobium sp. ISRA426]WGR77045.1 DUF2235 domain-containing protein [Bradyrhizobium sp. ISRA430]WGR87450.1 DUF2235 domain-containing protein [Bradyrhizobium sp. ISRA432]
MLHDHGAQNADPASAGGATKAEDPATTTPPKRKLVLFADGTGNAFTTQESSVWRLYEALDHTQPDQISYYIKGVGTAGWAPLAALDGATGIGVPANVRKLYRFLCWNWREGDEIYIFGFSRGAFTARTLAAMIASQGLVPAQIKGEPVSHAEMNRNAMAAWRKYRRTTVPFYKSLPTIWIARIIRDVLLFLYHGLLLHRPYCKVRKAMGRRANVKIEFLGLFDTVEAFGVPIEELRVAIDWAIWPISFRNHRLSDKVKYACHALALDDERTTFHPLRIDQSKLAAKQVVKEVWFAGVHSDVGGGYPECTLSFVPLVWMVQQLGSKLRFQDGTIEHFCAYQSAIGPAHDSRSGAAVLYRYGPRPILEGKANGGTPVVHFAVVERMLFGCDDYAPIMLPANARVLMPDGSIRDLANGGTHKAMQDAYLEKARGPLSKEEASAFATMNAPDAKMANLARGAVWWRRVAYFSLLIMAGVIVAWPWIAHKIVETSEDNGLRDTPVLRIITDIDWGLGAVIGPIANLLKDVLPSYAGPWLNIALYYPFLTSLVVLATWGVWNLNSVLRDGIQERARLAWYRPDRKASLKHLSRVNVLFRFGGFMQRKAWWIRLLFAKIVFPFAFIVAIYSSALMIASNSFFTWRVATGQVCESPETKTEREKKAGLNVATSIAPAKPVSDTALQASELFKVEQFCWASRLAVEKGRKYRIWIDMDEPWFDRTIMTGVNGFQTYEIHHYLALPIRRLFGADWFQPVVRVGEKGLNDQPLQAVNVVSADELPRRMNPTLPAERDMDKSKNRYPVRLEDATGLPDPADTEKLKKLKDEIAKMGTFDALAQDDTARKIWDAQHLTDRVVAEFVAPDSGELFFYVNDAVQIFPGFLRWLVPAKFAAYFGPDEQYYKNNSGTARITVQRLPPPEQPAPALANK